MPSPRRLLSPLLLLLALLPVGCDRGDHPHNLERQAPPFTLADGHDSISLAQFRGKVVVLNFWATWCAPCVQEIPTLLALHHEMPNLAIVAISIDENQDLYRSFLSSHHIDFLTLRDPDQRINHLYGTVQIPETYIINKNGVLVRKFVDAQNWTSPEITAYLRHLE